MKTRSQAKEKYYKNLKNLLDRINIDIENKKNEEFDEKESDVNTLNEKMSNISIINSRSEEEENIIPFTCKVCEKNKLKYTCPKCKINYCGVDCYRKHSLECTEDFYKRNVEEELKSRKVDEEDSKKFRDKLKDIYQRLNNDDNKSDTDKNISEGREKHLQALLIKIKDGTLDMGKDLTPTDWKEFNKFLDGYMNNDFVYNYMESGLKSSQANNPFPLSLWKPYWESLLQDEDKSPNDSNNIFEPCLEMYDVSLFDTLDEESLKTLKELEINQHIEYYSNLDNSINKNKNNSERNILEDLLEYDKSNQQDNLDINLQLCITLNKQKIPINRNLIYKSILLKYKDHPSITRLTKIAPHPSNFFALCNIICNLSYLLRLYNGDIDDVLPHLLTDCKILHDKSINYLTLETALNSFFQTIQLKELKYYNQFKQMVIKDLKAILKNKFYIFEMMVRLYEILTRGFNISPPTNTTITKASHYNLYTKEITLAKHKVIYFMSYVKDYLNKEILDEKMDLIKAFEEERKMENKIGKGIINSKKVLNN